MWAALPSRRMNAMTTSRQSLGQRGEAWVAGQMTRAGYTIRARNWRPAPGSGLAGELDIIAEKDSALIFVEVRTRRGPLDEAIEAALASVTAAKQARLLALAEAYLAAHQLEQTPWRVDVAAVAWDGARFSLRVLTDAITW